jgi:hypothetical protein
MNCEGKSFKLNLWINLASAFHTTHPLKRKEKKRYVLEMAEKLG